MFLFEELVYGRNCIVFVLVMSGVIYDQGIKIYLNSEMKKKQ